MKIKYAVLIIGLLFMTASRPASAALAFNEGQIFTFTASYTSSSSQIQLEENGLGYSSEVSGDIAVSYRINEINKTDETLVYDSLSYSGQTVNDTTSYNATAMGEEFTHFGIKYDKYDNGSLYLSYFDVSFPSWIMDNDFTSFNKEAANNLNGSEVVYRYFNWSSWTFTDFTLDNILGNMTSWQIMEQTTLSNATDAFTADTMKWSVFFDLSGYMVFDFRDLETGNTTYVPFDLYTISLEIEMGEDGIVKNYKKTTISEVTTEFAKLNGYTSNSYKLGGSVDEVKTEEGFFDKLPGFGLYMALFSITALPIIRKIRK